MFHIMNNKMEKSRGVAAIIISTLLFFLFISTSCGNNEEKKKEHELKEMKDRQPVLTLSVPVGKTFKYKLDIDEEGEMLVSHSEKNKTTQKRNPEKRTNETAVEMTSGRDGKIDVKWIFKETNPFNEDIKEQTMSFLQVDTNSTILMEDTHNFSMLFSILFSLPQKPLSESEEWKNDFSAPTGEKGFIKSRIVGQEEIDGIKCFVILSEFDMMKEKDKDFLHFEGKGKSYFAPESGKFISGERSFTVRSRYEPPGTKKEVNLEIKGNMRLSLLENTEGKSSGYKNK